VVIIIINFKIETSILEEMYLLHNTLNLQIVLYNDIIYNLNILYKKSQIMLYVVLF
jgi:hypothetical protein